MLIVLVCLTYFGASPCISVQSKKLYSAKLWSEYQIYYREALKYIIFWF